MKSSVKSSVLLVLAAAMLASMLIPAAEAQTAPVLSYGTVNFPTAPIKPEIDSVPITVNLQYALQNPAQPAVGAVAQAVVVTVTPTCDNTNFAITGPSSIIILVDPSKAGGKYTGVGQFAIQATRNAPGLQLIKCKFSSVAAALQQNAAPASNVADLPFQVKAGYFPLIQAKVVSKVQQAGPQKQIPFNIELTNFGNAQTQVTFSLGGTAPEGWSTLLPDVLILDSPASGGQKTTDTSVFTVATPFKNGWNNKETSFQVVMTPTSTLDASQVGNPLTASVLARVRGVYVPGFEPALMVLAVIGAAFVARSRKL